MSNTNKHRQHKHTYLFSGVEHFGLQTEDLLLGHGRLSRDLGVLAVESVSSVPLAPERL